jgi:hypothetical protein
MKSVYSRSQLSNNLQQAFANPSQLQDEITDPEMPATLVEWLTRLGLLHGVPFNYLVPDEQMLPPESIRFFYIDPNWVSALLDGAMSIGRNFTTQTDTPEINLHKAVMPTVSAQLKSNKPQIRASAFGMKAAASSSTEEIITGFVLRSSVVLDYPSMGVNIYPLGGTPNDPNPVMLEILRLEQLGPASDTLLCLIKGDAYRIDIHESPQGLHYGIDSFDDTKSPLSATKDLYTFGNTTVVKDGVTTNLVTMSETVSHTDIKSCFRSNRVLQMSTLANVILEKNKAIGPPPGTKSPTSIDSAEMGFEMTQGVGMVSFFKSTN